MIEESDSSKNEQKFNLSKLIVLSGFVLCLLAIAGILSASLFLVVTNPTTPLPEPLREWTGIAFGFLFGAFFNLVKDFVE